MLLRSASPIATVIFILESRSPLMKMVEAIAIISQDARELVAQYESQARSSAPSATDEKIREAVVDKIISRYSKLDPRLAQPMLFRVSFPASAL